MSLVNQPVASRTRFLRCDRHRCNKGTAQTRPTRSLHLSPSEESGSLTRWDMVLQSSPVNVALTVISTPASARETGQAEPARWASSLKAAASMPGT